MAVLEMDSVVGQEVRKHSQGYDEAYMQAVERLTDAHRRKLCKLEDGKVVQELRDLVAESKHQSLFPRLEHALEILENPPPKDESKDQEGADGEEEEDDDDDEEGADGDKAKEAETDGQSPRRGNRSADDQAADK